MRTVITFIIAALALAILFALYSCGGHSRKAVTLANTAPIAAPAGQLSLSVSWPQSLPVDKLQPWETLDGSGRLASSINLQSQFVPGADRFLEAGDVVNLGEASRFASGTAGNREVSYALYRIPMGSEQPGTIAADVNILAGAEYYLGVADYSANTWRWHGPFAANHVRVSLPDYAYTSSLGNLFLAAVAFDGSSFDLVGLGVNARDYADTTPPPALADAPWVSPYNGMVLVEWPQVVASDLAGYRVYINGEDALGYIEGGTDVAVPTDDVVDVAVSAVDISGNESAPSPVTTQGMPAGTPPACQLISSSASGMRGDIIALTASGGDTYDWDIDGDGNWDMVGVTDTNAFANTTNMGIIRPRIYAHTADGGFWMGAVSLVIAGNSRPVVMATADVMSGPAPLNVNFSLIAEDDDGTIVEYAWDFEGDGIFDATSPVNPTPLPFSYPATGMYNAKFRVTDNEGGWDVDTVAINVAGSLPPVALLNLNTEKAFMGDYESDEIVFNASASYDPDGGALEYAWDLDGNGFFTAFGGNSSQARVYTSPGTHLASVRVRDPQGMVAEASRQVYVYRYISHLVNSAISGRYPSLRDVGGKPAIAFYDYTNKDLMYARASTASPSSTDNWQVHSIDTTDDVGSQPSLVILTDGNPAMVYLDQTNGLLKFAHSNTTIPDSSGYWSIHTVVAANAATMWEDISCQLCRGVPIISYYDTATQDLKFARSTLEIPTATVDWATHTIDSGGAVGPYSALSIVTTATGELPAIYYYNSTNGDIKYARANLWPPSGAGDWTIYTLDDGGGNSVGQYTIGALPDPGINNGNPVVVYFDDTAMDCKIALANTLEPSSSADWNIYVLRDGSWYVGLSASVLRYGGRLFVSFGDHDSEYTWLAKAIVGNPTSVSDWWFHRIDGSSSTDWFGTSLALVDGKPMLAYYQYSYYRLNIAVPTL